MTNSRQRGFTIIEVALVLAVAALIFLVVFLAVPALQRNQRDDARKRDVSNIVQAVTNAAANTNAPVTAGAAYPKPATGGSVLKDYLDSMSGNVDYVQVVAKPATLPLELSKTQDTSSIAAVPTAARVNAIVVYQESKCDGNVNIVAGAKRSAAVVVQVENGGNGKYYCQDAN